MKSFIKRESETMPFSYIPYAFKCRLILLASVNDATKLKSAFRDSIVQRHRPHECHNGVYITDSPYIVHFATKYTRKWRSWLCALWRWLQYDLDGPYTIYPIWETVLHVDEVTNQHDVLCVNDTLVLFLTAEDSYDLIIPKITGPYSRLVLHGYNYTWPQVKRLIHKRVKQVRIMDCIDVDPEEYDDVVNFILRFSRSFMNKFAVRDNCFPAELMTKLNEAFKQHKTHSTITPYFNKSHGLTYFNHKRYTLVYCIICVVCSVTMSLFAEGVQHTTAYRSMFILKVNEKHTLLFAISICSMIILFEYTLPTVQIVTMIKSLFEFNLSDVKIMNAVNKNN